MCQNLYLRAGQSLYLSATNSKARGATSLLVGSRLAASRDFRAAQGVESLLTGGKISTYRADPSELSGRRGSNLYLWEAGSVSRDSTPSAPVSGDFALNSLARSLARVGGWPAGRAGRLCQATPTPGVVLASVLCGSNACR